MRQIVIDTAELEDAEAIMSTMCINLIINTLDSYCIDGIMMMDEKYNFNISL